MSFISADLIDMMIELNLKIISREVRHPSKLAYLLDQIAEAARKEAKDLPFPKWDDGDDLPGSMKFWQKNASWVEDAFFTDRK